MTEAEWWACKNLTRTLESLDGEDTSWRKLRLFAVACCRRVWHLLADDLHRHAVRVAEDYADGRVPEAEVDAIWVALERLRREARNVPFAVQVAHSAVLVTVDLLEQIWQVVSLAASRAAEAQVYSNPSGTISGAAVRSAYDALAPLCGDILNPFCQTIPDPAWLTPNVLALASTIYEDRAFDRLPILADAMMDAGCENTEILAHCRSPGPHVRGCWVIDLLLGKE